MPRPEKWLSSREFAEAAKITPQAARKALRNALEGDGLWRGRKLKVRRALGSGGRSGLSYEVELSWMQDAAGPASPLNGSEAIGEGRSGRAGAHDAAVLARLDTIASAMEHPLHSAARGHAVEIAALRSGRSERTLYRWLGRYDEQGLRGLRRGCAANAKQRRVLVSRVFDQAYRAAGYPEDLHHQIAAAVERAIKGLWASRAEAAGSTEIRRLAEFLLLETCEERGVSLPPSVLRLSRRAVERFALYRVVNVRRNDRKAFDDAKPRIRRDWTGLAPMERIVADVKHLDVTVRRADGVAAWPKIVAFMDAGTGRVFVHPVLLERGEGVRQEHVIEGFLNMVAAPHWGFPDGLYLDNGSEFGALVKIESALRRLGEPGARTIIFARPYNASAKPIESLFARLDRYVFSLMPGYAGPNRMAKKTQTVGKPPEPYPGSWEEFSATLQDLIGAHNQRPVGGQWANRSPEAWLQEKAAAGWRSTYVDLLTLDAAFSEADSRRVDRGVVKIAGKRFTHPQLAALPTRTSVDLALPWRRGADPLARIAGAWVYLKPEELYPARWIEGARESERRQRSQTKLVSELAKDAGRLDPVATKIRWSRRQAEQPAPSRGVGLDLGGELEAIGSALRDRPPEASVPTAAELRRMREMALTERLERQQRND